MRKGRLKTEIRNAEIGNWGKKIGFARIDSEYTRVGEGEMANE